jgi:hypothetical protein
VAAVLIVPPVVSQPDIRDYASFGLANLCSNFDYVPIIGRVGGVGPLVAIASSANVHSQCLGLAALRRLSMHPDNRPRLIRVRMTMTTTMMVLMMICGGDRGDSLNDVMVMIIKGLEGLLSENQTRQSPRDG